MSRPSARRYLGWTEFLVIGLLVVFFAILVIFMVQMRNTADDDTPAASTFPANLDELVAAADVVSGEQLVTQHGCVACHVQGVANHIAPPFAGLGDLASSRRPGLTANEYLYESIVHPAVFVVDDYQPIMAENFGSVLSDAQIADIIAYLLTQ
jgi:mono/diheme cytochrome c family protein